MWETKVSGRSEDVKRPKSRNKDEREPESEENRGGSDIQAYIIQASGPVKNDTESSVRGRGFVRALLGGTARHRYTASSCAESSCAELSD